MGERFEPQAFSPDYGDDLVADFMSGVETTAVLERATTVAMPTTIDFRLEVNCQKGNHYVRVRRFRGARRKKGSGTDGKESYQYLGIAEVVAHDLGGIYETRWNEFRYNHTCHYA